MQDIQLLNHTPRYVFDASAVTASAELADTYGSSAVNSLANVPHEGQVKIEARLESGDVMYWDLYHDSQAKITSVIADLKVTSLSYHESGIPSFRYHISWGSVPFVSQTPEEKGISVVTAGIFPNQPTAVDVVQVNNKALRQNSNTLLRLLALLMSPKAYDVEEVTPDEKLNRKRAKLGRPPLDSYKVIRIDMGKRKKRSVSSQSDGADGPVRALHRVRAHLRLVDGKIVRVRAHLRGSADCGIARRSYEVITQKNQLRPISHP